MFEMMELLKKYTKVTRRATKCKTCGYKSNQSGWKRQKNYGDGSSKDDERLFRKICPRCGTLNNFLKVR